VLATGAPYEPQSLAYMLGLIRPGSTVIDAGW
jgi:hypothetical protein